MSTNSTNTPREDRGQLQDENARLRRVVDTAMGFVGCLRAGELAQLVLRGFARNLDVAGGSLYLVQAGPGGGDRLVLAHSLDHGHAPSSIDLPPRGRSVFARALAGGGAVLVEDIAEGTQTVTSGWGGYRDGSSLVIPLLDERSATIGIVALHNKRLGPLTPRDSEIGQILASFAARALAGIRAMEESRHSAERLGQARKMEAVKQLAGGIAHKLNNLLTVVLGSADLLKASGDADVALSENLAEIIVAGRRGVEMTNRLMFLAGQVQMRTSRLDVHRTVEELVTLLRRTTDQRIEISTVLRAELSEVVGDEALLRGALWDLATRACDVMPAGGKLTFSTRRVEFTGSELRKRAYDVKAGWYLRIDVSDTAAAMDRRMREHIFEPFFAVEGAGASLGLGLAGAYSCVRSHHGCIDVSSTPPRGTTFTIYLPAAPSGAEATAEQADRASGKILVVDDEETVRDLTANLLRGLGYDTVACAGGDEAVRYYRQHYRQIDLAVIDLSMSELNGARTLEQLKGVNSEIRALLATGWADADTAQTAAGEGAVGFVSRPLQYEQLPQRVAKAIRR